MSIEIDEVYRHGLTMIGLITLRRIPTPKSSSTSKTSPITFSVLEQACGEPRPRPIRPRQY